MGFFADWVIYIKILILWMSMELEKVDECPCKNRWFIKYSKKKFLPFTRTVIKSEFSVKVNWFVIEPSESIKHLDVVLDDWIGKQILSALHTNFWEVVLWCQNWVIILIWSL